MKEKKKKLRKELDPTEKSNYVGADDEYTSRVPRSPRRTAFVNSALGSPSTWAHIFHWELEMRLGSRQALKLDLEEGKEKYQIRQSNRAR